MKRLSYLFALVLAGCVNIDLEAPVKGYYLLKDSGQAVCQAKPADTALLIDVLNPTSFYNAPNLAFGRSDEGRGYYQYAQWVERPAQRVGLLLRDRLRAACLYRQVALTGEGVSGERLMTLKLIDLYHDTASQPGEARIVLDVQLIRRDTARLIAHKTFSAHAPATSFDAAGAAAGFNRALPAMFDEIGAWLAQQPQK